MIFTRNVAYSVFVAGFVLGMSGCGGRIYDTPPPGLRTFTHKERPNPTLPKSAFEAAAGPVGLLPSIAISNGPRVDPEGGDLQYVEISVNGFPTQDMGSMNARSGSESISGIMKLYPVHPYFLVHGPNLLHIGKPNFGVSVEAWDYLQSKSHKEIAKLGESQDGQFIFGGDIPEWPWVKGAVIVESKDNLTLVKAEAQRFHQALAALTQGGPDQEEHRKDLVASVRKNTAAYIRASELRGKPYAFLDEMVSAAEGLAFGDRPEKSVELAPFPSDVTLELFAGGKLARLKREQNRPLITFDSTYDDGPSYSKGSDIVSCDLWYRQEGGQFVLDAVVPQTSTDIHARYEANEISTDNLARLFQTQPF